MSTISKCDKCGQEYGGFEYGIIKIEKTMSLYDLRVELCKDCYKKELNHLRERIKTNAH